MGTCSASCAGAGARSGRRGDPAGSASAGTSVPSIGTRAGPTACRGRARERPARPRPSQPRRAPRVSARRASVRASGRAAIDNGATSNRSRSAASRPGSASPAGKTFLAVVRRARARAKANAVMISAPGGSGRHLSFLCDLQAVIPTYVRVRRAADNSTTKTSLFDSRARGDRSGAAGATCAAAREEPRS